MADKSGKVISYTYSVHGGTSFSDIAGVSCTYTVVTTPNAAPSTLLPEWAYFVIIGGLAVLCVVLAIVAARRKAK